MRLVLRLAAVDRFELTASDVLGRPLWGLAVQGDSARFLESGARSGCRLSANRSLQLPRIDWELPVLDLPAVLVGRLPAASRPNGTGGPSIDLRDGDGRRWTAARDAAGPLRWTLWRGGAAALRWERVDRGGRLTARGGELQVRWRESAREPLSEAGLVLTLAPADEPECADDDVS